MRRSSAAFRGHEVPSVGCRSRDTTFCCKPLQCPILEAAERQHHTQDVRSHHHPASCAAQLTNCGLTSSSRATPLPLLASPVRTRGRAENSQRSFWLVCRPTTCNLGWEGCQESCQCRCWKSARGKPTITRTTGCLVRESLPSPDELIRELPGLLFPQDLDVALRHICSPSDLTLITLTMAQAQRHQDPSAHPLAGPKELYRSSSMDPKQRFYRHFLDSIESKPRVSPLRHYPLPLAADEYAKYCRTKSPTCSPCPPLPARGRRLSTMFSPASASCRTRCLTRLNIRRHMTGGSIPRYSLRAFGSPASQLLTRSLAQSIKALQDKLNETIAKVTPKSRFQFKRSTQTVHVDMGAPENDPRLNPGSLSRNQRPAQPIPEISGAVAVEESDDALADLPHIPAAKNYNEEIARPSDTPVRKPSFSTARNIGISNQTGLHIILPSSAAHATAAGSLTDLTGCVVDMSVPTANGTPFAGLALKNISRSLIVAGRVAGAVHVTNMSESILVVTARQVRIHDCKNVDVYLHCASHPIIEDCTGMRFAPLPACYVGGFPIHACLYASC